MKMKIVYIVCFLLCFSCANENAKKSIPETETKSEEATVGRSDLLDDADKKSMNDIELNFSLDHIEEKLQASYEAQILATKHPEFREAIKEQLANSNKFNATLSDSINTIEIQDMLLLDDISQRNDSIMTQRILYSYVINSKLVKKDSALVVMKHTLIKIDNEMKLNTSFSFKKLVSH